jgi:TRAP-type C4-dicarboxylate transport system permease large subunit
MTIFVAIAFLAILASLASALFFMLRGNSHTPDKSKRMAYALAMRVAVSIVLFVCILIAWKMGIIQPTGIRN